MPDTNTTRDTNTTGAGTLRRHVIPAELISDDDSATAARLATDLLRRAQVGVTRIDTPIAPLFLDASAQGLLRVRFATRTTTHDNSTYLAELREVGARIAHDPDFMKVYVDAFDAYFAGRVASVEVPIDFHFMTAPYRRQVLDYLPHIPYGRTRSYGQVAEATGKPKAMRAVGSACAHNPVPIALPCHRVVRADGDLGNYIGGVDIKRELLEFEAENRARLIG